MDMQLLVNLMLVIYWYTVQLCDRRSGQANPESLISEICFLAREGVYLIGKPLD